MNDRILSVPETLSKCGDVKSRNTLRGWIETRGFPEPIQISPGRIGWRESEVDAWIDQLPRGFLRPIGRNAPEHQAA